MGIDTIISLAVLLYSAILHEIAHGFVADRFGDPTARLAGRLSLNPKSHIDPFMSIILPLLMYISSGGTFFIGAAKPVPVDPFNLKEGRKDVALVALAGPLTNIIIAVAAALLLRLLFLPVVAHSISPFLFSLIYPFLATVINLNLLLAIFNLLPVPPLDGSKLFALILPEREANAYMAMGNIGFFILIFLLLFPIGGFSLSQLIFNLISFAYSLLHP